MKKKISRVYLFAVLAIVLITGACDINNGWINDWWVGETPEPTRAVVPITRFTVTFDMQGGSYVDLRPTTDPNYVKPEGPIPPQIVLADKTTVYEPGMVEKENVFFAGWWTAPGSGGIRWDFNSTPATAARADANGEIKLYARWSNDGDTVNFELNAPGGSGMTWDNTTYTPKQERVASGVPLSQPKGFGLKPDDSLTSKYVFTGWYTWIDGNGDTIVDNSELTPWDFQTGVTSNDTTLYAGWGIKTSTGGVLPPENVPTTPPKAVYTVTFDNDGVKTSTEVIADDKIPSPNAITKKDNTFTGWYTEPNSGGTRWNFDTSVTGNITLYAGWDQNPPEEYQITFNSNGGSYIDLIGDPTDNTKGDNPPSQTVTPGAGIVHEPGLVEPPEGKYFDGWIIDNDRNGTIDDGETTVWDFDTTNAANHGPVGDTIPLIARWSENGYTVTFDAGGDFDRNGRFDPVNEIDWSKTTYTPRPEKVAAGTKLSQPKGFGLKSDGPYPLADKYAFTGWYQDVNGNGIVDIGDTKWDFSTMTPSGNMALYAGWGTKTSSGVYLPEDGGYPVPIYTISFDSGGAETTPSDEVVVSGQKIPAPDALHKDEYVFTGWYTDKECTDEWEFGTDVVGEGNDGPTDDNKFTLYAGWEPEPYTYTWLDEYYYVVSERGSSTTYYPFEFAPGVGEPFWIDDNSTEGAANYKSQEDIVKYLKQYPNAIALITGYEDVQGDGLNTDREASVWYSLCDDGVTNPDQVILYTKLPSGETKSSESMIIGPNDSAGLAATNGQGHEVWVEIFQPKIQN